MSRKIERHSLVDTEHENHRPRDRHTFYQDECKSNYSGVGKKIKRYFLVDTEVLNRLFLVVFTQKYINLLLMHHGSKAREKL